MCAAAAVRPVVLPRIAAVRSSLVLLIVLDVVENRGAVLLRITVKIYFAIFIGSLLIQREKGDILPSACLIDREDRALDRLIIVKYVGMTRAKDRLHLFYVRERYGKRVEPSVFLEPLLEETDE